MGDFRLNINVAWCLAEAERHLRDWRFAAARELVTEVLRADASEADRLTASLMLAEVHREVGDVRAALDEAQWVAARCYELAGPRAPATVQAHALVGACYHDLGRLDQAEATYHLRVLDLGRTENRAVLLTRANLALLRRDRGDLPAAVALLHGAYVGLRRAFGSADLDTVRVAAELADLHRDLGDRAAARRLLAVAHAGARGRLGETHPLTESLDAALAALEPETSSFTDRLVATRERPSGRGRVGPRPAIRFLHPERVADGLPPLPESIATSLAASAHAGSAGRAVATTEVDILESWSGPEKPPRAAKRSRAALIVAIVVLLIGGAVLGWALLRRPAKPEIATSARLTTVALSAAAGIGPMGLRLDDGGTTLAVSWSAQHTPLVVALTRPGGRPIVLTELPPGAHDYTVVGVANAGNYCVVIGTQRPSASIAPGTSVCTRR